MNPYADMLVSGMSVYKDGYDYLYDAFQRSILYGDILRKRGNNYLGHLKQGQPPVLAFDYDVICDGRSYDRPVNYQLVKINDRRDSESPDAGSPGTESGESGYSKDAKLRMRPIIVMDPRAGHGPGIGGSKMDSQVGTALRAGHPVYFIMFSTEPVPGQTLADVQQCHVLFMEEVARRHPHAQKPAVIGNCQGGWAAALVAADRPDVTGPLVLNGSPLSYWGGVKGENPMRYRGGIFGGTWLASLSSDLGNGMFDGAHLVAGFEELNIANTLWAKQYNLYANVDTEEERYLSFEKWWGGFYLLGREEIHFIVKNLFISDKLEKGALRLDQDAYINLKHVKDPILVFASWGDNITPPQQALNWITKVYKSVEDIKQCGQTIIYLIHDTIGHLGIFVSSKVNRKEHREIIGCVDAIDFLAPGLYEMVIREDSESAGLENSQVEFVSRSFDDILQMDDGFEDEQAFYPVSAISKLNDRLYQEHISPWVRAFSNDLSAEVIRQLHPLRMQRYGLSDLNPLMAPFMVVSPWVKSERRPISRDNLFLNVQKTVSDLMINTLIYYQDTRDTLIETLFYAMYGNPWMKTLFFNRAYTQGPWSSSEPEMKKSQMFKDLENQLWLKAMKQGGFVEAVIRMNLAVTSANHVIDMAEYDEARFGMKTDKRLKQILPEDLKQIIKDQAALLEKDRDMALTTLCDLIPLKKDRKTAVDIARKIAGIETVRKFKKTAVLRRIIQILLPGEDSAEFTFSS
ncbi:MAG: DUF3141 domain-containing protein [Desulfobacteraceae bacterium]|nr:MAG: DUF3141 domain-containing protein [Desulfobacteraceae bacterium]